MPGKGTAIRTVRIDDELWSAVKARADLEGYENPSAVIRELLQAWVDRPGTRRKA